MDLTLQSSSSSRLSAKVIHGSDAISGLRIAWDSLFGRVPDAPVYLSFPWMIAFVSMGRTRGDVLAVTVWREETLVALLVISVRRQLGFRLAEVVGTGMPSFLGLLRDPQYPEGVGLIADALLGQRLMDCLCIHDLLSCDTGTNDLLREMEARGFCFRRVYRVITHRIKLEPSYEQYLTETKSQKRRHQLKKEEQRLFDAGGGVLECFSGPAITTQIIARMARIQNEGWQKEAGANLLSVPWHIEIVSRMAQAGMARAWLVTVNGDDAAFVLAYVANRQLHYFYTGYKTRYLSLSPGKTLTGRVIRFACESGFDVLDFGHSDQDYKRFWSTHHFDVHRVAIGRGPLGRIACTLNYLAWRVYDIGWIRRLYTTLKLAAVKRVAATGEN